jgi:hypothetical protein
MGCTVSSLSAISGFGALGKPLNDAVISAAGVFPSAMLASRASCESFASILSYFLTYLAAAFYSTAAK